MYSRLLHLLIFYNYFIKNGNAIYYGQDVGDIKEFKYNVQITRVETYHNETSVKIHLCGGTLVSAELVLTAAHCIKKELRDKLFIFAGSNLISGGKGGIKLGIKHKIIHGQYEEEGLKNDIALLQVATVKLSETIGIANFPWDVQSTPPPPPRPGAIKGVFNYLMSFASSQSHQDPNLVWGAVVGFGVNGRHQGEETHPFILQKMKVAVKIDDESARKCKLRFRRNDAVCAINPNDIGGVGLGKGDSGAGLVVDNVVIAVANEQSSVHGVMPDAYVDVAYHKEWILNKLSSYTVDDFCSQNWI